MARSISPDSINIRDDRQSTFYPRVRSVRMSEFFPHFLCYLDIPVETVKFVWITCPRLVLQLLMRERHFCSITF